MEWWKDIYSAFKQADIKQVAYVPDAGHAELIDACMADNDIRAVPLTTEEEGIAKLAAAWLGGPCCRLCSHAACRSTAR